MGTCLSLGKVQYIENNEDENLPYNHYDVKLGKYVSKFTTTSEIPSTNTATKHTEYPYKYWCNYNKKTQ
jgi:hypothetical protein